MSKAFWVDAMEFLAFGVVSEVLQATSGARDRIASAVGACGRRHVEKGVCWITCGAMRGECTEMMPHARSVCSTSGPETHLAPPAGG